MINTSELVVPSADEKQLLVRHKLWRWWVWAVGVIQEMIHEQTPVFFTSAVHFNLLPIIANPMHRHLTT